jgi:hypothetical protein
MEVLVAALLPAVTPALVGGAASPLGAAAGAPCGIPEDGAIGITGRPGALGPPGPPGPPGALGATAPVAVTADAAVRVEPMSTAGAVSGSQAAAVTKSKLRTQRQSGRIWHLLLSAHGATTDSRPSARAQCLDSLVQT